MQEQLRHHYPTASNGCHQRSPATGVLVRNSVKPWFVPPNHVAIRMLCHVSRVGGLIGKAGSIIRHLHHQTSAKIRVEHLHLPNSTFSPPSEVQRVILIIGSTSVSRKLTLHANNNIIEEFEVSAVQEAVVRVFERVIEVAASGGEGEEEGEGELEVEGIVSCRLLVESGQVGSLIGKGGKNIEMLKKETGCRIKVLTKERLPACAMANDEMVELEGDIKAVKKGLIAVTRCLQEYTLIDSRNMHGGRSSEPMIQEASFGPHMARVHRDPVAQPTSASYNGFSSGTQSRFEEGDMNESRRSLRQVIFNILCPNEKVGGVLGRGGSIIRDLQTKTGATITIGPSFPDCPERLITIAAIENPESRYSSAQSAVVLVFNRLVAASPVNDLESYSMGSPVSASLVVQSNVVGCLLGKGGAIISEMRKVTGAALRVIGCDQVPKCALGNVEIVQISGALANVQNAIYSVTSRLRENLLSPRMLNGTSHNSASSFLHKNSPCTGVKGHLIPERHPPHSASNGSAQQSSLVHHMDQLRLGQASDHLTPPKSWTAHTVPIGSQRSNGGVGIGSGSRSGVVMNSTLEVVVPDSVVDSIYGENGSNLSHLGQVSGAKVMVHEPHHGSTDRIIVISGSPEQTQAAHSLLQAYMLEDTTHT